MVMVVVIHDYTNIHEFAKPKVYDDMKNDILPSIRRFLNI